MIEDLRNTKEGGGRVEKVGGEVGGGREEGDRDGELKRKDLEQINSSLLRAYKRAGFEVQEGGRKEEGKEGREWSGVKVGSEKVQRLSCSFL